MLRLRRLHIVLVKVVAFKELLDGVTSQLQLSFFNSVLILPFRVVYMVRVEIVDADIWLKRRLHCASCELVPIERLKPRMRLDLCYSVLGSYSTGWLALNAFIDEVCSLDRPTRRHVSSLNLNLFAENLFSDLSPVLPDIRSSPHHALVSDDSDSKVVGDKSVVLPAHYFGSHVSGSARRLACVVRRHEPRDSEVSQPKVSLAVENQILRFDITMNDVSSVDRLKRVN